MYRQYGRFTTNIQQLEMCMESLNVHFAEAYHNGETDREVRLIDHTDNVEELRKR